VSQLDAFYTAHVYTEISFYRGSLNYFDAVTILFESPSPCPMDVFGFLVSHSLELALKAYLVKKGKSESEIFKIGHNLEWAWSLSQELGLKIEHPIPQWCKMLNSAHSKTLYFRYAKTNTALITPSKQDMYDRLNAVLNLVGSEVNVNRNGNVA